MSKESDDTVGQKGELFMNIAQFRREERSGDNTLRRNVFSDTIPRNLENHNYEETKRSGRIELISAIGGVQNQQSFSGTFLHRPYGAPTVYRKIDTPSGLENYCANCNTSPPTGHHRPSTSSKLHTLSTNVRSGRKTRIRFMSADHATHYVNDDLQRVSRERKSSKGVVTTSDFHKCDREKIYMGLKSNSGASSGNKVETPDVWLERARKLKSTKESTKVSKQPTRKGNSVATYQASRGPENLAEVDSATIALSRANFCDIRKNSRILKWLQEVNEQSYFEIVEH